MTFSATLLASDLAAGAQRAASLSRPSTIPILQHTLMRVEGDKLLIAGTNMDQAIGLHVDIYAGEGAATVDAAALSSFARKLRQKDHVSLNVTKQGLFAVTQGSARAELPYLPATDLPMLLDVENGVAWDVPGRQLADLLAYISPGMGQHDTRYYLNGFFIDLAGKAARLVATDGFMLAVEALADVPMPAFKPRDRNSTIVPAEAVPTIIALAKECETVTLLLSDAAIGIRSGAYTYRTKLVDGCYPDWQRVVPKNGDTQATVKRADFVEAMGRAFAFDQGSARLNFSEDGLGIDGYAYAAMAKRNAAAMAREVCELQRLDGESLVVAFSSSLLNDVMASLPGADDLTFDLTANGAVIRDPKRGPSSLRVIMPLRG